MIREFDGVFLLETAATAYMFRVLPTGHLQHVYYGKKLELGLTAAGDDPVRQKESVHAAGQAMAAKFSNANGCSVVYDKAYPALTMNDLALEVSGPGTGDFRSSAVEDVFADGTRTVDLVFEKAEVLTAADVHDCNSFDVPDRVCDIAFACTPWQPVTLPPHSLVRICLEK